MTRARRGNGVRHAAVVVTLALAAAATLGGCAAATPLCDQGKSLSDTGRLAAATEKYAQAEQRGEGDCADAGLAAAGGRYKDAYVNVARGRSAEEGRDLEGAASAYRAALVFDTDNAAARDGLARLQQPVPEPPPTPQAEPTPQPTPQPTPEPQPAAPAPPAAAADHGSWLGLATVGLLCAVLGLLAWLVLTARRTARRNRDDAAAARTEIGNTREQIPAIRGTLTDLRSLVLEEFERTKNRLDELDEQVRRGPVAVKDEVLAAVDAASRREQADAAAAVTRFTALDERLAELLDVLDDLGRDGTDPTHERFARP
jgi:hypothetical protein